LTLFFTILSQASDNVKWIERQTTTDKGKQAELKQLGAIPRHVAIIMDGNGRWAQNHTLPRAAGHKEGISSVRDLVEAASTVGVEYLTLYAFSTENWRRPATEVGILMDLLLHYLRAEFDELHRNNVRLRAIGKINALPKPVQKELHECIERMKDNTGLTLTLALSYSGRWDITRAMQMMALDVRRRKLSPEDITEESFAQYLSTVGMPDPDLLIRTSGELRVSNFLLWEIAYSEIYVTDTLFPDFRRDELYEALAVYSKRERRFGKTSAQIAECATRSDAHTQAVGDELPKVEQTGLQKIFSALRS
jgi:undecaprenyl diphosphate synthase